MSGSRRLRRYAMGATAVWVTGLVGLTGTAVPASAAYLVSNATASTTEPFFNDTECEPTEVTLPLKDGSFGVKVVTGPTRGEALLAPNASTQEVGVVTSVRVRPKTSEIVWAAAPLPGGCYPDYGEPIGTDENGNDIYTKTPTFKWKTDDYDFEAKYKVRHNVQLTRRSAARLASTALSRQFGNAYENADTGYPRCRRPRHNSTLCSTGFFQGDVSWGGYVRVKVGTTRNHRKLRWSYRLNVLQVNEYCLNVNHGGRGGCTDRIHRNRTRIAVPGGKL